MHGADFRLEPSLLGERLDKIEAVDLWHFDVDHDQIRPGLLQGFEGVRGAMMRADDLDARRPTKEVGETLDRQRLVVDDHDPEIAHGRSSSGTMIRFSNPPPAEASARRLPRSP